MGDQSRYNRIAGGRDGGGRPIAAALAAPLCNQSLLFDQQGQAALQHSGRDLECPFVPDGFGRNAVRMGHHYPDYGVKFLVWNLFWHATVYLSRTFFCVA
jgi:hypothetical protein